MADLTVSSSSNATSQAYDIAQQNAADASAKLGKHVVGQAQAGAAGATLGATAAAAAADPTDSKGSVAGAANQSKAVVNTDAPTLPDPTGPSASPSTTMRVVKGSDVFRAGGDGVFAALQANSDARQTDINSAMLVKRGQAAIQLTAKQQEYDDKKKEIHGMEVSSITKLASSLVGLGLSAGLTVYGNKAATRGGKPDAEGTTTTPKPSETASARQDAAADAAGGIKPASQSTLTKDGDQKKDDILASADGTSPSPNGQSSALSDAEAKKAVDKEAAKKAQSDKNDADASLYRNLGLNVTGSVDAIHNILDVNAGGQAQQNAAALAQKQDAIQAQVAQTNVDSAGAWLDNAKDQRKSAQQAIQTHVQMIGDSISNVWK